MVDIQDDRQLRVLPQRPSDGEKLDALTPRHR